MQLRKGKRVEAALEAARDIAKNDPEPYIVMGEFRELLGEPSAALDAYRGALQRRPDDLKLKQRVGYWQSQSGQLDDALLTLSALHKKGFDATSEAELGFVLFRRNDVKGAAATLHEVIKKEPGSMAAHYYLGAVLYAQNDVKGATEQYLEADKLAPNDSRPLAALCEMQARSGASEVAETKKQLEKRFPEEAKELVARCAAPKEP
jgi:cytochrome c-type biogenesis protein CcmH/NrfG